MIDDDPEDPDALDDLLRRSGLDPDVADDDARTPPEEPSEQEMNG